VNGVRFSGALLEAWFGLGHLAQDHSFYLTTYQPRRPHQTSMYETFLFLNVSALIMIMIFGWSMSRSVIRQGGFCVCFAIGIWKARRSFGILGVWNFDATVESCIRLLWILRRWDSGGGDAACESIIGTTSGVGEGKTREWCRDSHSQETKPPPRPPNSESVKNRLHQNTRSHIRSHFGSSFVLVA
jgi:hypothetical protein